MTADGEVQRYFREVVMAYDGEECLIWPYSIRGDGYGQMYWQGRPQSASRVLCLETRGEPPTPKHQAAHSCGNGKRACVTKRHLLWKTRKENEADKLIHDTHNRGERHVNSKIKEIDVVDIRALAGTMSQKKIAQLKGISTARVSKIIRRETWAWL